MKCFTKSLRFYRKMANSTKGRRCKILGRQDSKNEEVIDGLLETIWSYGSVEGVLRCRRVLLALAFCSVSGGGWSSFGFSCLLMFSFLSGQVESFVRVRSSGLWVLLVGSGCKLVSPAFSFYSCVYMLLYIRFAFYKSRVTSVKKKKKQKQELPCTA